jgi:opacity protein-like surface antigen
MKINLRSALVAVTAIFGLATSAQEADVTVAIDADFTIFTEGSPEEPVAFASYGTGSFTSYFPSWSVSKVYQAGGALLIADGG